MAWTVRALADELHLRYEGDGERRIARVAPLERAGPDGLAFVSRNSYLDRLASCEAGAVIVAPEHAERVRGCALLADNPYAAYARAAQLLHPLPGMAPGVDPDASVDRRARLAGDVHVGARAVVDADAEIGAGCVIAAGACVGAGARLGAGTRIGPGVVIGADCALGSRCLVQAGAVVGSDGFGYAQDGESWIRIPQIGRVVIGDDVDIGANTTIDRGALDDTVIGDGVILDNQIQIAHNVRVGEHTAMAGCVGIAGSAVIGRRCTIGGAAAILGHLEVVDDVHITAMSLVMSSITEPGTYSSGAPLEPNARWRRNAARFRQLDALARRVGDLERRDTGKHRGS
ncbi:MAG: UDP-3-O-(3-hydroxymyristoyl)glucosamine N-acyltransferase [Halofilum sp. (in: g-proteobacteria)]|nr:UDP-3-O-(3-hydroxymyristoyl)glucosamine N-acyltransferase [Halofilum sp. (in: g-proteobacteria)]